MLTSAYRGGSSDKKLKTNQNIFNTIKYYKKFQILKDTHVIVKNFLNVLFLVFVLR